MKTRNALVMWALLLAVAVLLAVRPVSARPDPTHKQKVVVHLSHYPSDKHAVMMATHFAAGMQEQGAEVTMMLDVDGVRLADKRPAQKPDAMDEQITKYYETFIKDGGKVMVCPHCAEVAGISAQNLRPGAKIAKDLGELASLVLAADKTLDY